MEVFKSFQHVLEVILGGQNGGPGNGKETVCQTPRCYGTKCHTVGGADPRVAMVLSVIQWVGQTPELLWY